MVLHFTALRRGIVSLDGYVRRHLNGHRICNGNSLPFMHCDQNVLNDKN